MSDLLGGVPSDTMRRVWMAGLAKLCQPGKAEVAAAGLVGMLPALRHVDDVAFNEDTAREIARKNKSGVPSFGVIEPILVTWQQRNRPKVSGAAQISAPEKPAATRAFDCCDQPPGFGRAHRARVSTLMPRSC